MNCRITDTTIAGDRWTHSPDSVLRIFLPIIVWRFATPLFTGAMTMAEHRIFFGVSAVRAEGRAQGAQPGRGGSDYPLADGL